MKLFMNRANRDKFLKTFPLPKGWKLIKKSKKSPHILLLKDGYIFQLDFSKNKPLLPNQNLVQAIGFKNQALSVLDITAGWAKEAFLMFKLGCQVTAIESNPFVFYLVQENLEYNNINQLKMKLDNGLNYLKSLKNPLYYPDIIFMDPMFGSKKSLSKKPLTILKQIVGETTNKQQIFDLALLKAKKRVVVKRHKLDKPLNKNILCSFKGRSVCYDVFNPKGDFLN
ncbi:MAG: class I SAM-dependent methyltransferase [Bdellovibrionaceae bacterium]|nr:class I SAM-dependent methyltransferase [Pseudobdellovibrionaceae bacterium]